MLISYGRTQIRSPRGCGAAGAPGFASLSACLAAAGEKPERDEETLERLGSRFLWGVSSPPPVDHRVWTLRLSARRPRYE